MRCRIRGSIIWPRDDNPHGHAKFVHQLQAGEFGGLIDSEPGLHRWKAVSSEKPTNCLINKRIANWRTIIKKCTNLWAAAFKTAGYEIVNAPGEDVLKLMPTVFDLYVNVPATQTAGRIKIYAIETGQATLELIVRDSLSGALLGRIVDKRTAGANAGRMEWKTSVSNRADFRLLFERWAKIAADGLTEPSKASPLPETLQPNQKLPKK